MLNSKYREAELFSDLAHSSINQKRKYTNEPYIVHPRNVAYLIQCCGGTDDMVNAAYLHDVIEDVAIHLPEQFGCDAIKSRFGSPVLELVISLTDISRPEDGNRDARKKIDRLHIVNASMKAKIIKLADLIDNSLTICEYDPDFAKIYLKEKRLLLNEMSDGNSLERHSLWRIANDILLSYGY